MEKPIIEIPKKWTEKFFECKSIGPTPSLNKEGFWEKPNHNEFDKEFKRQNKKKG